MVFPFPFELCFGFCVFIDELLLFHFQKKKKLPRIDGGVFGLRHDDSRAFCVPGDVSPVCEGGGHEITALNSGGVGEVSLPAVLDSGATAHLTGDRSLFVGRVVDVSISVLGIDPDSGYRCWDW